jgi:hypothetical protein
MWELPRPSIRSSSALQCLLSISVHACSVELILARRSTLFHNMSIVRNSDLRPWQVERMLLRNASDVSERTGVFFASLYYSMLLQVIGRKRNAHRNHAFHRKRLQEKLLVYPTSSFPHFSIALILTLSDKVLQSSWLLRTSAYAMSLNMA